MTGLRLEIPASVPLRDRAYQVLREAIVSGHLTPGERLVEARLAQEMGISRNPVREALRRLEHEGLARRHPRGGMAVAEIDLRDVAEVYAVRSVLEGLAARLAAGRLRAEHRERLVRSIQEGEEARRSNELDRLVASSSVFHSTVLEAAGNARLTSLLQVLDHHISRFRRISLQAEGSPAEVLEEHRHILDALERGDGAEAEDLMRRHLEHSGRQILRFLGRHAKTGFAGGQGNGPGFGQVGQGGNR
ncbi:MAG: GntR family transcriptional regulator [Bacillota bacterium]|nr:GntR family transcriptional regulator [Bacillota bacterium]MDI7248551.1 GntR family transcriptional regulator [Bacillota bacterium]